MLREVHQPVEGRSTGRVPLGSAVVRGRRLGIGTPLPVLLLLRQAVDLLTQSADVERQRITVPGEVIGVRLQGRMSSLPRTGVDVGRQRALRERRVGGGLTGDFGEDDIQARTVGPRRCPRVLRPRGDLVGVSTALLGDLLAALFETAGGLFRLVLHSFPLRVSLRCPGPGLAGLRGETGHLLDHSCPVPYDSFGILQLPLPGP